MAPALVQRGASTCQLPSCEWVFDERPVLVATRMHLLCSPQLIHHPCSMMTRPDGDSVIVAELQNLVSLRNVRGNDSRSSIQSDTRTGHRDRVISLDARRLRADIPKRAQLHRDCSLLSLKHYINPITASFYRRGFFDGQNFAPDRFNRFNI